MMTTRPVKANEKNTILLSCSSLCNTHYRSIISTLKLDLNEKKGVEDSQVETEKRSVHQVEIKLWSEVVKYKDANDLSVISYLHGFYCSLLQAVNLVLHSRKTDPYFVLPPPFLTKPSSQTQKDHQLLVYNILIRLGDLNRYLRNQTMARYYYCQARELNPFRGHAYNQLALIAINDGIKSIYYYTRAVMASEEPFVIAENNLKSAVNRFSITIPVIKALFSKPDEPGDQEFPNVTKWLHVTVIAIHADNVQVIVNPLLVEGLSLFRGQSLESPASSPKLERPNEGSSKLKDARMILPSLDLLIEYLTTASNDKINILDLEKTLSELKWETTNFLDQHGSTSLTDSDKFKALKYDYQLLGFSPLTEFHEKLSFENNVDLANESLLLVNRISEKLEKLLNVIQEKKLAKTKKSRNIALQSILNKK